MIAIFISDASGNKVREVIWKKDDVVMSRIWREDGSIEQQSMKTSRFKHALREIGDYVLVHAAEVDDESSAFKYLGKSTDLVETLPEVSIKD